ncbi:MAG: TonB-dependent receptor, partial [Candidatus Eremiobacteraeota bacterium]|nr:TonB-dependent receptor [Candidatus Eremiobacteraeota bacterium]
NTDGSPGTAKPVAPVFTCAANPSLFTGGQGFGIANTNQRDSVVNVHFGLPHKTGNLRDDVQLMYLTSEVVAGYYSSANDLGHDVVSQVFGPLFWNDGNVYTGPLMQPFDSRFITPYFFPSSPAQRIFQNSPLPGNVRDVNDNGIAVVKAQYQHNINADSFVRLYGYTLYSNWFIWGPNSAAQPLYGAELADYEIPDHTRGFNLNYTNQINAQHLITLSGSYTASQLQRYSNGFIRSNPPITTLVDGSGNCVDGTGTIVACYGPNAVNGTTANPTPVPPPPGAQFLVTESGFKANLNQVHTRFTALSLTDEWRPSDRLTLNLGVRGENYAFPLGDTRPDDPARQFWFTHYNAEHCFGPGSLTPFLAPADATGQPGLGPCPAGTAHTQLTNVSAGTLSATRIQPRLGFTYEINPDTVVRGSFGVYARPENSSWVQYDTVQEDLASFLGTHFYSYGFTTPRHDIRPDTSYNADFSLEKRLRGTDWSFKITPFYRSTKDQLQNFFIDPLTGLESGLNVGHQVSYGVELAVRKGDFSRDGWSGAFTYTYTHSRIQYRNFDNSSRNVIDNLNDYIAQYNAYTQAGGGAKCYGPGGGGTAGTPDNSCGAGTFVNPYYNLPAQPLLDRNAYYTTYDVIPGPVSAANGYEMPNVATLIVNYKKNRFAITPSIAFNGGAKYGSPLVWPGYVPDSCASALSGQNADPSSCDNSTRALPFFIPDAFTGRFDNLGDFKQPWRLSANLAMSYDVSSRIGLHLALTNLIDHCGQRGYAWDQANVCVYGALPSGIFSPAGNFYPNSISATAPVQMRFPYAFWLNNTNTGFVGVKLPFQATFNVSLKL